ncbi:LuxR C-terminal-related transcriptional regulator [Nocardia sp. CDC159]|uniref:LuxR C-terminal-related transcriptional regulator n=1 Tax=Nocardia pulmonis TaxID=2951408 RepID=A0A9X2IXS8_9NOCA|nr:MULTISPECIES: LuxR C-terminal-related transcriptional regulator [Nocardia]MCM6776332.1 LuxR C-terminal-related transcriptional regulator [Nocardia pulmonis]MCM6788756.1 LuxR C-terminal-related transcriptional regulator [Nocardia sp. CDC159]
MSSADLLRPRDADALRAELRQVASVSGMPVVFGGQVHAGTLILSEFFGTRTNAMRGLAVTPASGVGGAAVATKRPASVSDYRLASTITHHYDAPVLTEGLRAVVGVPVVVSGQSRAVLYIASRDAGPIGDRAAELVLRAGRRLAVEIAVRDEVDRRLWLREAAAPVRPDAVVAEQLRDIHAEVRGIAQTVTDEGARTRLREVSQRLARLMAGPEIPGETPALAPRELDVLAHVALGCTNAEAAQRLSLRPETVKSYLRSAMTKLGAHTRHEAVVRARRAGLLP